MDTTQLDSFRRELAEYNRSLDSCLRCQYGMTLTTFKTIKATTQLLGAAAGVYAMHQGADPMASFALIAIIISGPEVMEYLIKQSDGSP